MIKTLRRKVNECTHDVQLYGFEWLLQHLAVVNSCL